MRSGGFGLSPLFLGGSFFLPIPPIWCLFPPDESALLCMPIRSIGMTSFQSH
jgi:hypothetical protein